MSHTILLVDDDRTFCAALAGALRRRGHTVLLAHDYDDALAEAQAWSPDRAVIDLRMPGRGGLEVVQALRAALPQLRMVVLTGYGSIATAVEAIKQEANEVRVEAAVKGITPAQPAPVVEPKPETPVAAAAPVAVAPMQKAGLWARVKSIFGIEAAAPVAEPQPAKAEEKKRDDRRDGNRDRGGRNDRGDRRDRNDRNDRGDRKDRNGKGDRNESRGDRDNRSDRKDRGDAKRDGRTDGNRQGDRAPREQREPREQRDARNQANAAEAVTPGAGVVAGGAADSNKAPRENRENRENRGERGDRGGRRERGERGDRPPRDGNNAPAPLVANAEAQAADVQQATSAQPQTTVDGTSQERGDRPPRGERGSRRRDRDSRGERGENGEGGEGRRERAATDSQGDAGVVTAPKVNEAAA